jgi:hypothetical protein
MVMAMLQSGSTTEPWPRLARVVRDILARAGEGRIQDDLWPWAAASFVTLERRLQFVSYGGPPLKSTVRAGLIFGASVSASCTKDVLSIVSEIELGKIRLDRRFQKWVEGVF